MLRGFVLRLIDHAERSAQPLPQYLFQMARLRNSDKARQRILTASTAELVLTIEGHHALAPRDDLLREIALAVAWYA